MCRCNGNCYWHNRAGHTQNYILIGNAYRTTLSNRPKGSRKLMLNRWPFHKRREKRETNLYRAIAHCRIIKEACFSTRNGFPRNRYGGESTRRDLFYSSLRYLCWGFFIKIFIKIFSRTTTYFSTDVLFFKIVKS